MEQQLIDAMLWAYTQAVAQLSVNKRITAQMESNARPTPHVPQSESYRRACEDKLPELYAEHAELTRHVKTLSEALGLPPEVQH